MNNDGLTLNQLAERNAVLVSKVEKLRTEREQLAAENVALKQAAEFATASDMWIEQADGMLDYRYHEWYVDVLKTAMETPATDRIYAGIKAEAKSHDLNAFISHYSAELDAHIESGGDQFDAKSVRLRSFIVGGRMFREKLRDEEKALALREGAK
ncbi:hypothetical protein [Raoultella planticola]|uniref:hypothetical protein n=1 Tax=Raoultella planticola TaxID=575 RepID=UPI002415BC9B|nr:hypothetical protein [Raoultella planticola]MDV1446322.1 hypothetical protein [Raoultella planticola]MDV1565285.1 hypothetical protein [Raoultella planticola]MDV1572511.1 hypothetical protein [Raoultella planticola]MDV1632145.1 hypothetical protein [Raoultella planticola]MDW2729686.1 hypothetical protein [Raoultella planticola]